MVESRLFQPLSVGPLKLSHRLVMAPLTRFRANEDHVQLPFVHEYYGQRASVPGTLLITEATFISQRAAGYGNVPGIWSKEQIAAWRKITETVHAKGSFIYCQLWALGRTANPEVAAKEGFQIVSSSPTPMEGRKPSHELSIDEIHGFTQDYVQAAKNAIEAGFDGVEIHGANGYLVDQFIQDKVNQRSDKYGGSVENRSRFCLEVTQAVADAIGADRTGIRLSPWSTFQGMRMSNPIPQFTHVIEGLRKIGIAYLHVVESRISGNADVESSDKLDFAVEAWQKTGPIFIAGGFTPDSAVHTVDVQYKDEPMAVVFGRYFISTPDLPYRIRKGIELTKYDRDTFYKPMSKDGYIDYPFSSEFVQENKI